MIKKIVLASIITSGIITGTLSAQITGDAMMKKDEGAMMKKEDASMMIKKDEGAMMMKKETSVSNTIVYREDVIELQNALIEGGYLKISSTTKKGYFGKLTRAALVKYQRDNGIIATGNFGPLTKAKLADKKSAMMKRDEGAMMMKKGEDAMMKKETSN